MATSREVSKRLQFLNNASFMKTLTFEGEMLDTYGMRVVREILDREPWKSVVGIREPVYQELTKEFLATVVVKSDYVGPIMFRMLGERRELSMNELNQAFGCAPDGVAAIDGMDIAEFWRSMTNNPRKGFSSGKTTESALKDKRWKVIHHIIARTLFPRYDSTEKLNNQDLVVLWGMKHHRHIDIGYLWKDWLCHRANREIKTIQVGPFVTKIARYLDILTEIQEEPVELLRPMEEYELRNLGCIKISPDEDPFEDEDALPHEEEPMAPPFEAGSSSGAMRRPRVHWDMDIMQQHLTSISEGISDIRLNLAEETAARERQWATITQWRTEDDQRWTNLDTTLDNLNRDWENQLADNASVRRILRQIRDNRDDDE